MLTLAFSILMIVIFGKLLGLAIRGAWAITKIIFTLVFLPFLLIILCVGGLVYLALPILLVIGLVTLISSAV